MKKILFFLLLISSNLLAQMTLYVPTKSVTLCKQPASESYMTERAGVLIEVWNESTSTLLVRRWDKDGAGVGENNHPSGSETTIPVNATIKVVVYNLSRNRLPMQVVIYGNDVFTNGTVYEPSTFAKGIVDGVGSLSGGNIPLYKELIGGQKTEMRFTATSKEWWKINCNCMFYSGGFLTSTNPNNSTNYGSNFFSIDYTPTQIRWNNPDILSGNQIVLDNTTTWTTATGTATNQWYSYINAAPSSTAVSTLIEAQSVIVSKASTYHAKIFKRKVKGVFKYYWYTVDAEGNKLKRGGQVKGTPVYNSLSEALANIPQDYSISNGGGGGGGATGTVTKVQQYTAGVSGDSSYQIDNEGNKNYFSFNGEFYTQVNIVPQDNYHVAVTTDTRGFGTRQFVYKLDSDIGWKSKAELEAIDFSNMKGRDVSIMAAMFSENGSMDRFVQSIVHFKGDNTANVPSFYVRNTAKRLPQFGSLFPNFSVTGKTNILQFGQLDNSFNFANAPYLSKGFNVVDRKGNTSIANSYNIVSNYDTWAYSHGCPEGNAAAATTWLANQSMSNLYTWFFDEVINPNHGQAAVMVDFEAWYLEILGNQDACNKMATLWRAFKQNNPTTKLLSYVGSRGYAHEATFGALNSTQVSNFNAMYNQTASQVRSQFEGKSVTYLNTSDGSPTSTTGYLSEYLDVINAGDYQHFINHSWLYSTVQELELSKKHRPTKQAIPLFWSYIEPVSGSDFTTTSKYVKTTDDNTIWSILWRPAAPFSYIHSLTAFATLIGDGIWFWSVPYASVEGYNYWGWFGRDANTTAALPNKFSANNGAMEGTTTIGYDYSALALYEMSFNNDILTGSEPVLKPEYSLNNEASYYTGDNLLPASSDFYNLPIIRIKKHPTLNEWLIVGANRYNPVNNNQVIKVKIPNTSLTYDLTLKGQFATIDRIKLN